MIFVGNDWAEAHHDVCVTSEAGEVLGQWRVPESVEGLSEFHERVGKFVSDPSDVVIGIETSRGLWVEALVASGYRVCGINPLSVSIYRGQQHLSGAKSDRADAKLLADMVRNNHRELQVVADDSDTALSLRVMARTHQNLIWDRQRHVNELRDKLREYHPAGVKLLTELPLRDAIAVLGRAPTPVTGGGLTKDQIEAVLKAAGRQRGFKRRVNEIHDILSETHLSTSLAVADAYGATTKPLVTIIVTIETQIAELTKTLEQCFEEHPDAAIYLSFPGIGSILGARVLGEFGDDPNRFADAKCRRNYAGTSPITRQSGRTRLVLARRIRKRRLYNAIDSWALSACNNSPGTKILYDHRRQQGDGHHQALRAVGNRLVGFLHGCLKTGTLYNEEKAWANQQTPQTQKAA